MAIEHKQLDDCSTDDLADAVKFLDEQEVLGQHEEALSQAWCCVRTMILDLINEWEVYRDEETEDE